MVTPGGSGFRFIYSLRELGSDGSIFCFQELPKRNCSFGVSWKLILDLVGQRIKWLAHELEVAREVSVLEELYDVVRRFVRHINSGWR